MDESCSDGVGIGDLPVRELQAQQEGGVTGNDRGREAGAAPEDNAATGRRAEDMVTAGKNSVSLIRGAPVAAFERHVVRIHGADGHDGIEGGRHVQAFTAVVSRRRDDQHVLLCTGLDRLFEKRFGRAGRAQLSPADIEDVRAMLDGLQDGTGQIELRAHDK